MVGGATRMPFVRALASRLFRKLPESTIDPDYVVAMGAAVQSALCLKHGALDDIVMTDVSPFSLGILSRNETMHGAIEDAFVPIIERNTILPASRSQFFSTVSNNQTKILVAIFQGEAPIAQDNVLLGQVEVDVPAGPAGHESISVRFSYDVNGLLQVEVTVLSTNITREIIIDSGGKKLDAAARRESLRKLEKLKFHPREDAINQEVLEELNTLYAMHLGEDRDMIQGLIARFMAVMDTQDPRKVTAERKSTKEAIKHIKNNYVL